MINFLKIHKIVFWTLIVVLFAVVIWGTSLLHKKKAERAPRQTATTTTQQPIGISAQQGYKPINGERKNAEIKDVVIKIGIDIDRPFQDSPYNLRIAKGHYLIWIYETGKLIFNGKEVYAGDSLGHIALSANGLHYAYTLKTGVQNYSPISYDIYVDGEKTAGAVNNIEALALTDDREYFYASGAVIKSSTQDEIFRGSGNTVTLGISSDGSTYFAYFAERFDKSHKDTLVRNGVKIYEGSFLRDFDFSPEGEHYTYTVNDREKNDQTLIVDGQVVAKDSILILSSITSLGHYAGWNSKERFVFIDDKKFPIKGDSARVFINEPASHHLIYNEGWLLDGEPVQLPVDLYRGLGMVEMTGDIVYVYNVIK